MENKPYLCSSYPENNLFTLSRLIPIEDLERLPVKVIAFFINNLAFLLIALRLFLLTPHVFC